MKSTKAYVCLCLQIWLLWDGYERPSAWSKKPEKKISLGKTKLAMCVIWALAKWSLWLEKLRLVGNEEKNSVIIFLINHVWNVPYCNNRTFFYSSDNDLCFCCVTIIGEGRFGKVYAAVNNNTGELIAMKEVIKFILKYLLQKRISISNYVSYILVDKSQHVKQHVTYLPVLRTSELQSCST